MPWCSTEIPVGISGAAQRRERGLCAVPEERNGHAAVPEFTLVDNGVLSGYRREKLLSGGLIRAGRAADFAEPVSSRAFDVRTPSAGGGRLEPVGRQSAEVHRRPGDPAEARRAVVSQPTWGVDAGAAAAIHAALWR